jgi:hypothetical protein
MRHRELSDDGPRKAVVSLAPREESYVRSLGVGILRCLGSARADHPERTRFRSTIRLRKSRRSGRGGRSRDSAACARGYHSVYVIARVNRLEAPRITCLA